MNGQNNINTINDEGQEQIIDLDQLAGVLGQGNTETNEELLPPIELDIQNLEDCQIDKKEFQKGIKRGSELAGYFTVLKNAGVDSNTILQMILNEQTIQHNIDMAKINNEAQIEIVEKQQIVLEKQQV